MLHKRLPLIAAGEVIDRLALNARQITRATAAMDQIVRSAWQRRSPGKRALSYEEFTGTVTPCHWVTMFEACALIHLGRIAEAVTLTNAARPLNTARSSA